MQKAQQQQQCSLVVCNVAAFERLSTRDLQQMTLTEPAQHKYMLGELLGSGTAAKVVVGTDTVTQAQYAVKILPKLRGQKNRTEQIKAEVCKAPRF